MKQRTEKYDNKIGSRIQLLRIQRGMRQEQLAKAVCLTPNFLSAIERGVKFPSIDSLIKIMTILNVPADAVFRSDISCDKIIQIYELTEQILTLPESLQPQIFSRIHAITHDADRENL